MRWYECEGPDGDVAVCTCVDLFRNPAGIAFPDHTGDAANGLYEKIGDKLGENGFADAGLHAREGIPEPLLREEGYLPPTRPGEKEPVRLYVNEPCHISVTLGGEEHIRIRGLSAGLSVRRTYDGVLRVAEILEEVAEPAFSPALGYLTRDPARVGAGLEIGVRLYLPFLTASGGLSGLSERLFALGLIWGTPDASGALDLSHALCRGIGEETILIRLTATARQLIASERAAAAAHTPSDGDRERGRRALGILQSAESLRHGETLSLLRLLRNWGDKDVLGNLPGRLAGLFVGTKDAVLLSEAGEKTADPDRARAGKIRAMLSGAPNAAS